jgi:hypothetical protein
MNDPNTRDLRRQTWETMNLRELGRLADIIQGGGGKVTTVGGDPGEPTRKPPGQG